MVISFDQNPYSSFYFYQINANSVNMLSSNKSFLNFFHLVYISLKINFFNDLRTNIVKVCLLVVKILGWHEQGRGWTPECSPKFKKTHFREMLVSPIICPTLPWWFWNTFLMISSEDDVRTKEASLQDYFDRLRSLGF